MIKPSANQSETLVINDLLNYCSENDIYISPSIAPQRIPGRGLGIYTTKSVKKGTRLMSVPTSGLVTVHTIPLAFASAATRTKLTVHALLSAYLAFGIQNDDGSSKYDPWMATWPALSDFLDTLPVLWPESLRNTLPHSQPDNKSKKTLSKNKSLDSQKLTQATSFVPIPPTISGAWTTMSINSFWSMKPKIDNLLNQQVEKLEDCLEKVAECFPDVSGDLHDNLSPTYWRFVYIWSCVNTRCFYYVKPGEEPPEDSNEAMALCPGMDLFNHSDDDSCTTRYDADGYFIDAARDYNVGEEVLLSYGAHTNDALWTEYGFLLDSNKHDGLRLDSIVINAVTRWQRSTLESYGYYGDYWLRDDGICWRTEVVAYIEFLTTKQWTRLIEGYPVLEETEGTKHARRNGSDKRTKIDSSDTPRLRGRRRLVDWILQLRGEAENSLVGLFNMTDTKISETFADQKDILVAQGQPNDHKMIDIIKKAQGKQRHGMCVQRWKQIWDMCTNAIRAMEEECEGAFIMSKEGRTQRELDKSLDSFLAEL